MTRTTAHANDAPPADKPGYSALIALARLLARVVVADALSEALSQEQEPPPVRITPETGE